VSCLSVSVDTVFFQLLLLRNCRVISCHVISHHVKSPMPYHIDSIIMDFFRLNLFCAYFANMCQSSLCYYRSFLLSLVLSSISCFDTRAGLSLTLSSVLWSLIIHNTIYDVWYAILESRVTLSPPSGTLDSKISRKNDRCMLVLRFKIFVKLFEVLPDTLCRRISGLFLMFRF